MPYNVNPPPQSGVPNPWGLVPGPVGLPNPSQDLSSVFPNLSGVNSQLSNDIMTQLSGQLNPATIANIQDQAAAWGVGSGMPGFNPGSLTGNKALRNLGLNTEQLINQGIGNYNQTIPTVSNTQTVNPALQANIAANNALNAAAPNPQQAAQYAQNLFNQYLAALLAARGGPAGGTIGLQQRQPQAQPFYSPAELAGAGTNLTSTGTGGVYDPSTLAANDPLNSLFNFTPEEESWMNSGVGSSGSVPNSDFAYGVDQLPADYTGDFNFGDLGF